MNLYSNNSIIEAHADRLLPIGELLGNPDVQEISINSPGKVYGDYGFGAMRDSGLAVSDTTIRAAIRLLMAATSPRIQSACAPRSIADAIGKADLSSDMALRIEKAFGVKMDTLMRMQNAYDIAQARKREKQLHLRRIPRTSHAHP